MRMSNMVRWSFAAVAAAAVLILVEGCYFMPGSTAGNAKVALAVKGVPANLSSVVLVVTGPGMATVSTTASTSAGSVTVSVPAGPARTFTLLLNGPSATLEGVATVDLQPGESKTINVTPTVGATQLVIPDPLNSRLVQISDISGTGWLTVSGTDFFPTGGFVQPEVVDFDNLGRIYMANGSGSVGGLLRFDDITHVSTYVSLDATTGINSVAVDRLHGMVYYSAGSSLLVWDILGQKPGTPDSNIGSLGIVKGIASDEQGMLYLTVQSTISSVVKYDPTLPLVSRVVGTYNYSPGASPFGVMAKGPYVYVCDTNGKKIDRFDKNLNFVDSFSGPSNDPLLGPETFVALLNRKFTVIDEDTSQKDRLVSFDDMTGAGWTTFGTFGYAPGQNVFRFYRGC